MTGPVYRSRYDQLHRRNVVSLDEQRRVRLGQINREYDNGRVVGLEVVFPDGKPVSLDHLVVLPNMHDRIAEAVLEWGKQPSVESFATKYTLSLNLKAFCEFMTEEGFAELTLCDLTVSHMNAFVGWLNDQPNRGRQWAEDTMRDKIGAVRTVLEQVRAMVPEALNPDFHVPNGNWVGIAQKANPTRGIEQPVWDRLWQACVTEIRASIDWFEQCQALIVAGQGRVPDKPRKRTPYNDPAVFAASLDAAYPGTIPDYDQVDRDNPALGQSLRQIHRGPFLRGFYPYGRELAPFVVLLALYTLFNATPLLNLRRSEITTQQVLGQRRIVLAGYKARKKNTVRRSFAVDPSDPLSPGGLLEFLGRWTRRLRPLVSSEHSDRVFLFVPNNGTAVPRGFSDKLGPTHDRVWKFSVRQFLQRHGIEGVGLKAIRTTGLDVIHSLFDGDVRAVAAAGGQSSFDVVDKHYKSNAAARRNDEDLAGIMATRERYAEDGRNDPRGAPSTADIYAATPGGICLDPYDSPVPGQKAGQLCTAYGMCWYCPLLKLALNSPYQLARAQQFREEILAARGYLVPNRWDRRWRRILLRLEQRIIPTFVDPEVIERARVLLPNLPRLPKLD